MIPFASEKKISVPASNPAGSRQWVVFLVFMLLISYLVVLGTGIATPISLGDEVYHYRFAKTSFWQNERATVDALYRNDDPVRIRLVTDPGWPLGLSFLWRAYGKISPRLAQIYHSVYFFILISGTFLFSAVLYSVEIGLWSALLTATVPMMVSFGILFYSDLPATALSMFVFFCVRRRHFLAAGVLMGLAFLIKKGTLFFMPALLPLVIYFSWPDKKKIALTLLSFLIPIMLIVGFENAWQVRHLPSGRSTFEELNGRLGVLYQGKTRSDAMAAPAPRPVQLPWVSVVKTLLNVEFSNSHILKLKDDVRYFGLALPFLFLVSFFKYGFKKPAWMLALPITVYTAAVLFLCLIPDIRYLMPLTPFLCIFAARSLPSLPNRVFKGMIILVCAAQLFAAAAFVYRERQIPKGLQEGLRFIQTHTPEGALFLSPDLMILEYANRRIVWGLCEVRKILWGTETERLAEIERIQLDYIAVKKARIYEDKEGFRHIGGYPKSFLEILKASPFVSLIFENEILALWKIDREKIVAAEMPASLLKIQ